MRISELLAHKYIGIPLWVLMLLASLLVVAIVAAILGFNAWQKKPLEERENIIRKLSSV